jgi:hypothetical protein
VTAGSTASGRGRLRPLTADTTDTDGDGLYDAQEFWHGTISTTLTPTVTCRATATVVQAPTR